jgi:tetratricopeptide (TPR) repeat protein
MSDHTKESHKEQHAALASYTPQAISNFGSNYGVQGIFQEQVHLHHYLPHQLPPVMPIEQAHALLASLPVDDSAPIPAPQALPKPHYMPWSPNPLFLCRQNDMRGIASLLQQHSMTVVVSGIAGIGKTQLAIEVAHRYGCFFGGGVFWLSFADPDSIPNQISMCGMAMGLYRDHDRLTQREQVQCVLAAWETDLPHLLIFDNCESERLLRAWKPKTGAARVLVTSRRDLWSDTLGVTRVSLDVLSSTESVQFLQARCADLRSQDAATIAEALGHLPLALHLAGSFFARYMGTTTPESYLASLRQANPLDHPSLQGLGTTDTPTEQEPNVARAFAQSVASLNAADTIDVMALKLLARAACLAPGEPFPRVVLMSSVRSLGPFDILRVESGIQRLQSLGLVEARNRNQLRLHRLIGAYTMSTLPDPHAHEDIEETLLQAADVGNCAGTATATGSIFVHLLHMLRCRRESTSEHPRHADLLAQLGAYQTLIGHYPNAQPLLEQALALHERLLGPEHLSTAQSCDSLARLYQAQGQVTKAQQLYEQVLHIRTKALGAEHPDTLQSLRALARLCVEQQQYDRAQNLFEQALEIRKRVQGPTHLDTATSLDDMASLFEARRQYSQALQLYQQAQEIRERLLGADHFDIAKSLSKIADIHSFCKQYHLALPLYQRALAIRRQTAGANHPATAHALRDLALLLYTTENYGQAQQLLQEALQIYEQTLGNAHPHFVACLNNLATLHHAQGAYGQALVLYQRALKIQEQMLGPDHPKLATNLNNLAALYHKQGNYEQAQQLYLRALGLHERALGSIALGLVATIQNLAILYKTQGQYDQALPLYRRIIQIHEQEQGAVHLDTAEALHNLAILHHMRGASSEALPLLEHAHRIYRQRIGADHPAARQVHELLTTIQQNNPT